MRRAAAAIGSLILLAGVALAGAGPVAANPDPPGHFTAPDLAAPLPAPPPPITGIFGHLDLGCATDIEIKITPLASQPAPNPSAVQHVVGQFPTNDPINGATNFAWPDPQPVFASNGPYHLEAIAHKAAAACLDPNTAIDLPAPPPAFAADMVLAVPPARPPGPRGTSPYAGRVTLQWPPNSEADRTGYLVYRVARTANTCPAATDANKIGETARNTYTDILKQGDPSGVLCYSLRTVRKGAAPDTTLVSDLSDAAAVTVASASSVVGGTNTTGKVVGGHSTGRPNSVGAPDGGYKSTLPFQPGAHSAQDDTELGTGEADSAASAQPQLAGPALQRLHQSDKSVAVKTLGTFAGGLVVAVVCGHLLLLRREVNRLPALEVLEPGS